MIRFTFIFLATALLSASTVQSQPLQYPSTKKVDQQDNYFGTVVKDPYRWLEDDQSPETANWVKEENAVTESYMSRIPFRDSLKSQMKKYWGFVRYDAPFKSGNNYFYYRTDGTQNQPVLFYMKSLEYVPMSYFDVNKVSADGTTAISQTVPSHDGNHLVFVLSEAGSDWNNIRIKETKSMKSLPEVLVRIKFSGIGWWKDGFFYSRYDVPKGGKDLSDRNEFHKIYYHKLNTAQETDSLVYEDKQNALRNFSAAVTEDEHFLVITGSESTSGNSVFIQDLTNAKSKLIPVVKTFDNDFELVGNIDDNLVFVTNYKAPKRKVILINSKMPQATAWKDLIAEQPVDILQSATLCWKSIMLNYMKDASSHLYIYNLQGARNFEIPFNGIGTIDEVSGSPADTNVFISFTTFTSPAVIYRYNMKNNRMAIQFKPQLPYNADEFETKQVFYTSKDGTKIPMFLVSKKGYKPDGKTPTLLFGYGGFNISKTPEFKSERMIFLEHGGLFAMPSLRGGGEYGTAWHEAGTKLKKQNVFDDFIAAAEYLVKEGYTSPEKLGIGGRSNGGLLVGAAMTERPDLFKVALPAVGVMDMLRFHKFTIGWAWKSDYGSSEDSSQFKAIYKYSPLHNIKEIAYPATLVTTADHDDRVVPAHSFKFISTLQEKQKGDNPVLIRIDSNAGHGSGKPTGKLIDEQADVFSFLFYNLGMTL